MSNPCLYVCVTCTGSVADNSRSAADFDAAGEPRPGAVLYEALRARIENAASTLPVAVQPVICLANCERGCSVAIAQAGKWGYLLGDIGPETVSKTVDDLISYGSAYAVSRSGTVMRRNRPESLQKAIVARFPVPGNSVADDAFLNRTVSS